MLDEVWLVPLGMCAGMLGSIIGLGGGIIIVPVLTFLGLPPTAAAGNSLFAAFGNAAASTVAYSRQGRIEYGTGLRLGLLCVPGTVLGALASADVTPGIFKMLFAAVLAASAAYIILRKSMRTGEGTSSHAVLALSVGASFFAGVVSGLFGIGGGIIFVPLMVVAMGMSMKRAAPTAQLVLLFASFSGLAAHSLLGHPDFVQAGYLTAGAFAGGLLGARLSQEIREGYLRILVSAVLLAAAVKMVLDA